MTTLFPLEPLYPPGFVYVPDFLSLEEEQRLLETVYTIDLKAFNFHGYEAKRAVASFGAGWSFAQQALVKGPDIPTEFNELVQKVADKAHLMKTDFAQLLVTEYPVGSVINWHRDAPPYGIIAGVSLLADCTFRLRPHRKEEQGRKSLLSFTVARRSLYVMQGASRTGWEHSTLPVREKRYSVTLRTLR
jgi:alkylated DNA repair dioxygenase AlkB